jgi:hypothetical protein
MPTINIEADISVDALVKVAEQLSQSELQRLRSQVLALSARRAAPSVSQGEAEYLMQISQRLPSHLQRRYDELMARRDAETLSVAEHGELLQLSQQAEALDVKRVEALAKLAQLRGVPLGDVLRQLKIDGPSGATGEDDPT